MLSFFQFRRRNSDRSWGAMMLWWGLVPWSVGAVGRVLWGYRTVRRRNVPRHGAALVIANHHSMIARPTICMRGGSFCRALHLVVETVPGGDTELNE